MCHKFSHLWLHLQVASTPPNPLAHVVFRLDLSHPIYGGGGLVAKLYPTLTIPWAVACQAPLSMGFFRQDTGVGCHFLLQGIFLTQGWFKVKHHFIREYWKLLTLSEDVHALLFCSNALFLSFLPVSIAQLFLLWFFSYLFIYLFIFIVVGFVIHWNESAMDLHVFPIPIPPPISLSTWSL